MNCAHRHRYHFWVWSWTRRKKRVHALITSLIRAAEFRASLIIRAGLFLMWKSDFKIFFKLIFLMFLHCFNELFSKINFKKIKKILFWWISNEKYFEKQPPPQYQTGFKRAFGNAVQTAFPQNLFIFLLKINFFSMFWIVLMRWSQK